jgi:hypothetical protein
VRKIAPGPKKNVTTYTNISMTSMIVNEVNDKRESLTFQKEEKILNNKDQQKIGEDRVATKPITAKSFKDQKLNGSKPDSDWKSSFTSEEKKFLTFLLKIIPEKGDPIQEKHATWWIKTFGIEKIKIALQVYWQQVEKAKKDAKVPTPTSIGAYVRNALNREIQPCRESDQKNKSFAEEFKKQFGWNGLTITEKYCRAEEFGKEWHYNLPEALFKDILKSTFENYCCYAERQSCVA